MSKLTKRQTSALLDAAKFQLSQARALLAKNPKLAAEAREIFGEGGDLASIVLEWGVGQRPSRPRPTFRRPVKANPQAAATAQRPAPPALAPLADATDSYLIQAATHRSAPLEGKSAARAELEKRGYTISPDGQAIMRSMRGGRALKLSNHKP